MVAGGSTIWRDEMATEQKLREALELACKFLDMSAFELRYPEYADQIRAALSLPTQAEPVEGGEVPLAWQSTRDGLIAYVLQEDLHNRLTPRVIDIAYSAFMSGAVGKNNEDGGKCDWFNDTKPMVLAQIEKIKHDLNKYKATTPPASQEQASAAVVTGERVRALHRECATMALHERCNECQDYAIQEQAQQPQAASVSDMAVYQSIADGYHKDAKPQAQAQELPDEREAFEALEKIAEWNSHDPMLGVDHGSNGVRDFYRQIARAALSAQAVPNPWRDAVIEQLECWHIYVPAIHDNSPRLAIKALVNIETQAALDPKVSSQAAALAVPDERDNADAERYRWLLANYARGDGYDNIDAALNDGDADTKLSQAIDAAIAARKGGE